MPAGAKRHRAPVALQMSDPGSTPHALFLLLVAEVIVLLWLRRSFRTAHGG